MATTNTAPATYKQPSRKGKKAWRKNVDVTQLQDGLEDVRGQIIQGGVIAEKTADQLFAIDTTGSSDLQKEYNKRHRPLKVDEILNARSAVPAVSSRKRLSDFEAPEKKRSKISHKELQRLRSIAYGGDAVHKDVVQTGDTADHDPWAVQEVKLDPVKFSFLEEEKSAKEPVTLKRAPISMAKSGKEIPAVRKPEAGKSYNPLLEDWANLIDREGAKEVEAEKKRLQEAKEDAEKLERVMAVAAAEEAEDEAEQSAWESEWEGFSEPEDGALKRKRPERKTPSQRNKINRRKAMERQAKHDARMKERDRQIRRIQELVKSIKEKEDARTTAQQVALIAAKEDMSSDTEEEVLRKKRFGKAPIPQAPLEVVLADELQDSLRRLKPEGNLLKDRFRSMMIRGKVESRKQISHAKQAKTTATEKWTYKDWKLE